MFFCALAGRAQSGVLSPPLESGHKGRYPFEPSNRLKSVSTRLTARASFKRTKEKYICIRPVARPDPKLLSDVAKRRLIKERVVSITSGRAIQLQVGVFLIVKYFGQAKYLTKAKETKQKKKQVKRRF